MRIICLRQIQLVAYFKNMIRESFSKIKNRKAGQPPVILSEMVKITREAGIDMIIDQVSQIIGKELFQQNGNLALL